MFDARNLRRLRALDIVPLRRRVAVPSGVAHEAVADTPELSVRREIVLQLWFAPDVPDPLPESFARMLRYLLRSLDLDVAQVARMAGENGGDGEYPVLAFGIGAPDGAVRLPALEKLRNPLEKRIAWPILRGLRRRLRRAL